MSEHAPLLEYRHTEVNCNVYNVDGLHYFSKCIVLSFFAIGACTKKFDYTVMCLKCFISNIDTSVVNCNIHNTGAPAMSVISQNTFFGNLKWDYTVNVQCTTDEHKQGHLITFYIRPSNITLLALFQQTVSIAFIRCFFFLNVICLVKLTLKVLVTTFDAQ